MDTDAVSTILRMIPGAREISQAEFWAARGGCRGGIHVAGRSLFSLAKSKYRDAIALSDSQGVQIRYRKMTCSRREYADAINRHVVEGGVWTLYMALEGGKHACCGPCTVVRDGGDHWILTPSGTTD
jgi:hypothetical protein